MTEFIVGIDGGGTSCRAAIAGRDGRILGQGRAGASNILTDPDLALAHIREATDAACAAAGIRVPFNTIPALLGLAGNNAGDAVSYVRERLPFARTRIESDGLIALEGAIGEGDGSVAILGTGSIFYQRHRGRVESFGGWGFIIGDFGSGAKIGQTALAASLLAHDGIGPASPLTETLLTRFGAEPGPMVAFARTASPGDFGSLAPLVFAAAQEGDRVASAIIAEAALMIDRALDRMIEHAGTELPLSLLGGLAEVYRPWLAERHRRRVLPAKGDAVAGAVALAHRAFIAAGDAP